MSEYVHGSTIAQSLSRPLILTVPGLDNSGPSHWQSLWEADLPDCARIDLGLWSRPKRTTWVSRIDQAVRSAGRPVILVAHSLGCHAVAWWAHWTGQPWGWPVAGALLVAPPDLARIELDERLTDFAPTPLEPLPFPTIVVGSNNDRYAKIEAVERLAMRWEAAFADVGESGHINAESQLGWWVEGQELLARLIGTASLNGRPDHSRADILAELRGLGPKQPRPSIPVAHRADF